MKVEEKVFDLRFGHGKIREIIKTDSFPEKVIFDGGFLESYTIDGRSTNQGSIFLSLTEYNLADGGFVSIESEIPAKVGDMVYCWDSEEINTLCYGKITEIDKTFVDCYKLTSSSWCHASKEIPQWFIDDNK